MSEPARYLIGIDLGTTNTAVAFVDTKAVSCAPTPFELVQLTAPGEAAPRRTLPSFLYLASADAFTPAQRQLPWPPHARTAPPQTQPQAREHAPIVGALARSAGVHNAAHLVASAKSWLGHHGVDRLAPILPWGANHSGAISPVGALAEILCHVQQAWDHAHPHADAAFAAQDVTITVPASFDDAARELVLRAASLAGYPEITLLEEPMAAFYAYVAHHGTREVAPHSTVLVLDMGGGTTDFSLITAADDGTMNRTAVGDHILLGGDNIDLALAKGVEQRQLAQGAPALDAVQWHGLVAACRHAKERLLAEAGDRSDGDAHAAASTQREEPILLAARGSKLIGGSRRDQITSAELNALLFDGFFPAVALTDKPARARSALLEFGLPYAADPAVTRHLAAFLTHHQVARIDAVLFNGGAMIPRGLRARVLDLLATWFTDVPRPRELAGFDPDLSVALGAAHFGLVRRGVVARIGGGLPRNYYVAVGVNGVERAMCIAPKGASEGSRYVLPEAFALTINRPVAFRLFSTTEGVSDVGRLYDLDAPGMAVLPPIVTALRGRARGGATSVHVELLITELGRVELWCQETAAQAEPGRWRLTFDARGGGSGTVHAAAQHAEADHSTLRAAQLLCQTALAGELPPTSLIKQLEQAFGMERNQWPQAAARGVFDEIISHPEDRKRGQEHEQRWLTLAGFCLRPGSGVELDAWRIRQLWGIFQEGPAFPNADPNRSAWWVMWRRVAAGLGKGQQEQIYDRLAPLVLAGPKQAKALALAKLTKPELAEMWRCLASLERLPPNHKHRLARQIVENLAAAKARAEPAWTWCLGRLLARMPLYGTFDGVVAPAIAAQHARTIAAMTFLAETKAAMIHALIEIGRRTGDRARDLSDADRAWLRAHLATLGASATALRPLDEIVALDAADQAALLGESLPPGLALTATPATT